MTIHTWKNYTFNKGMIFLNTTMSKLISIYENEVIIIKIKGGLYMKKIKILLIIALSMSILVGCGKNSESNGKESNSQKKSKVDDIKAEDTTKATSGETEDSSVSTDVTSDSQASTDDKGEVQKKNEEDTSIDNNTNESHSDEKNDINLNYIVYNNVKYGFQIKYPKELSVLDEGIDDEGMAVTNEEGDFCMYAYGFNNEDGETIDSMKDSLMVDGAEAEDIDNGFVLTYEEDGIQNKYVMKIGTGSINVMIITYPMDKEEEYKNMVNAIIGNFTTGDLSASY